MQTIDASGIIVQLKQSCTAGIEVVDRLGEARAILTRERAQLGSALLHDPQLPTVVGAETAQVARELAGKICDDEARVRDRFDNGCKRCIVVGHAFELTPCGLEEADHIGRLIEAFG